MTEMSTRKLIVGGLEVRKPFAGQLNEDCEYEIRDREQTSDLSAFWILYHALPVSNGPCMPTTPSCAWMA